MEFFFLPMVPVLAIAAVLAGIALGTGGLPRARAVAVPYLGPAAMFMWAVMMQGRSAGALSGISDWRQAGLIVTGAAGLLAAVWILIRNRTATWRWLLIANTLPLILLTAVAWFWGSFWMWAGP